MHFYCIFAFYSLLTHLLSLSTHLNKTLGSPTPYDQTPCLSETQRRFVKRDLEASMEACVSASRAVDFQTLVLRTYERFCRRYRKSAKNVDYRAFKKHIGDVVRRSLGLSELRDALSALCSESSMNLQNSANG